MFRRKTEFSGAIAQQFRPDDLQRFGLSGTLTVAASEPVQSLLAVGTADGAVHVFGEGTVQADFSVKSGQAITYIGFVKGVYLVVLDSSNYVTVIALDTQAVWAEYSVPNRVVAYHSDPAMDWFFLGLENGQISVFDIDRGIANSFRVDSIQKQVLPGSRMSPVRSIAVHPRDPSSLLICYNDLVTVFGIADSKILVTIEIPKSMGPLMKFAEAKWHPSGSHILTRQIDGSLSFWDGNTGHFLTTRNLQTSETSSLAALSNRQISASATSSLVSWCSREEPENTYLIYASGSLLTMIDFGPTPIVAVTKYETMGKFFAGGAIKTLELGVAAVEGIPLPKDSPYFTGTHNPPFFLVLTADNEQKVVKLPKFELKILDSAVLPHSLSWRSAQETCVEIESVARNQWFGMMMSSPKPYLHGGTPAKNTQRRSPTVTVVAIGGSDGAVKLFDGARSTGSDYRVLETSIADLIPEETQHQVVKISVAGSVGEMAVASKSGHTYLMSFKKNTHGFDQMRISESVIENIAHRSNPEIREGFLPQWVVRNAGAGQVSALRHSSVGFVGIGYADGRLLVVDRRGPAIILDAILEPREGFATAIAFGIQAVQQDSYSSVLMSVGTSQGEVILFKILPRPQGGYQLARASSYTLGKDQVTYLAHIDTQEGKSAEAVPAVMALLGRGIVIPGGLIALSKKDARIFSVSGSKPKLAHKSFDPPILGGGFACLREGDALGVVVTNTKGKVSVLSVPGLSTLFSYPLIYNRFEQKPVHVSLGGDLLVSLDEYTAGLLGIWGIGETPGRDQLYKPLQLPARPTISTTTWIGGRQFVRIEDLDELIGGARRPKSQRANTNELVAGGTRPPEDPSDAADHGAGSSRSPRSPGQRGSLWGDSTSAKSGQKTWGQTFNEYYDSAENNINDTLDDWMDMIKSSKKNATNSAVKGVVRNKLGF